MSRFARLVENALASILRAGGGLLLVISLLFLARAADAQLFTVSPVSFAENVGTATVTLTYTGTTGHSVSWATKDGTATAGSDYTATSGSRLAGNRVLPGQSVDVSITITDDSTAEDEEHFFLTLTFADGTPAVDHRITIEASDKAVFTVIDTTFAENVGSARIRINNTGDRGNTGRVSWATKNGTGPNAAIAGSDYTATSGSNATSFGPGAGVVFNLAILNDNVREDDEHFFITVTLGGTSVDHRITIQRNDQPTSVLSSNAPNLRIDEGQSVVHTVTLNPASTETVTVVKRHANSPLRRHLNSPAVSTWIEWPCRLGTRLDATYPQHSKSRRGSAL